MNIVTVPVKLGMEYETTFSLFEIEDKVMINLSFDNYKGNELSSIVVPLNSKHKDFLHKAKMLGYLLEDSELKFLFLYINDEVVVLKEENGVFTVIKDWIKNTLNKDPKQTTIIQYDLDTVLIHDNGDNIVTDYVGKQINGFNYIELKYNQAIKNNNISSSVLETFVGGTIIFVGITHNLSNKDERKIAFIHQDEILSLVDSQKDKEVPEYEISLLDVNSREVDTLVFNDVEVIR